MANHWRGQEFASEIWDLEGVLNYDDLKMAANSSERLRVGFGLTDCVAIGNVNGIVFFGALICLAQTQTSAT